MKKKLFGWLACFAFILGMLPAQVAYANDDANNAHIKAQAYKYFAYAANYNSNNITAYSVNAETGALTELPGSPYETAQYPSSITATADGKYIYVTNKGAGAVSGYAVNPDTGALTALPSSPYSTETFAGINGQPAASVISPDGSRLYAVNYYNYDIKVFSISSNGVLTSVGSLQDFNGVSTPFYNIAAAVHPSGKYLYTANSGSANISAFKTDTLERFTDSPYAAGTHPQSIAVHPDGKFLYVANYGSNDISAYQINAVSGAPSQITGSPFKTWCDGTSALVICGNYLYAANGDSKEISVFSINTSTGALTEIDGSPFASGKWPFALSCDPTGKYLYVANSVISDNPKNISAYKINSSTGALTAVPGSPFVSGSMTYGIVVVRGSAYTVTGYTVSFDSQGGSTVAGQTVAQNGLVTKPSNPSRPGFAFGGWYKEAGCINAWNFDTDTVSNDLTLYAKWIADTVVVPIVISAQKTDATAYGASDGSIIISAAGGSGSFEYSIDNGVNWSGSASFNGLKAGTYAIAVRDANNKSNTAFSSVTVDQPQLTGGYSANKLPAKAKTGMVWSIKPPAPPKGMSIKLIKYASSNLSVAYVDDKGNITFLKGGKVKITISVVLEKTVKGKTTVKTTKITKQIEVVQPVSSITLDTTSAVIAVKKTVKLKALVSPATASNKKLNWKSSNGKIAAVSKTGVVTGKKKGTAVITCIAQDGSKVFASCTVTVN